MCSSDLERLRFDTSSLGGNRYLERPTQRLGRHVFATDISFGKTNAAVNVGERRNVTTEFQMIA